MVSCSSRTNHKFLILVTQVTNVSPAIESFVTFKNFPISKTLVMEKLLQIML